MKGNHPQQVALLPEVHDQRARGKDGGMARRVRGAVEAIEVGSERVSPIMAATHTVRIEQRDELEDKVSTQLAGARIMRVEDEAQKAVEHVAGWCFPRVHARCQHKYLPRGGKKGEVRGK